MNKFEARQHFAPNGENSTKQLQKEIAICLQGEGWGNDVPTASGLVDSRGRQMNIDLAHRIQDGFEFIELKLSSDTPYDAALQVLRHGAVYMLYRLEPELARRFRSHEMMRAKQIILEVLAPRSYYSQSDVDLLALELELDHQVAAFAKQRVAELALSFRFAAFHTEFRYQPDMGSEEIRDIVNRSRRLHEMVQITGYEGQNIDSFDDWSKYALPVARRERHWKEHRSEFELAREWTLVGPPTVPLQLSELLDSHPETRGTVVRSGRTQHETSLPFSIGGPRCHDIALRAERNGREVTICVEAKADESFGGTVTEKLAGAWKRIGTKFPDRLTWLTQSLLGLPAFVDDKQLVLSDAISSLQYQLFAAVAGTLLEAQVRKASLAILVVHEFRTIFTADTELEANATALSAFLDLLHRANNLEGYESGIAYGQMIGPLSIFERPVNGPLTLPSDIPLFIGKIRTDRITRQS